MTKKTPTTKNAKPQAAKKAAPKRSPVDWERIELDYRAGVKTLRQMAKENGISHGAISNRSKRENWERDLKAKIQAKADSLVSKALVSNPVSKESKISERETIEANAGAIAEVRLSHRKDIGRSRRIAMALLDELELQTGADNVAMLEEMADLLRSEDDRGQDRLNDLYRKIISLPERAKTMKSLADSLRVTIDLERQAFGVDDKDNAHVDALTALLADISERSNSAFRPIADDPEHDDD